MGTVGFGFCALFPYLSNIAFVASLRGIVNIPSIPSGCGVSCARTSIIIVFYYLLPLTLRWELLILCPNMKEEKRENINLIQKSVYSLMRLMHLIPFSTFE